MSKETFTKLGAALRRADPDLHRRLRDGASPRDLDDAERSLGLPLPAELRELYAWRDGQNGKGTFPAHGESVVRGFFLSLEQALSKREDLVSLRVQEAWPRGRWSSSWLPVIDGGQGDFLCVDLEGGGVLELQHETARRPLLYPSTRAWLERVTAALEATATEAVDEPADACVAEYLEVHAEPARSWPELRQWIRGLKTCGSAAVFARIALALDDCPRDAHHPVMRALVEAVERWLADPSAEHLNEVRAALDHRNRQFVPRQAVSFAAQHGATAAISGDLDRACDGALHAVADVAPGVVDGDASDAEERCVALQKRLRVALGG